MPNLLEPTIDPLNPNDPQSWIDYLTHQTNGAANEKDYIRGYGASTGLSPSGYDQAGNAARLLDPAEYYKLAQDYGFHNSLIPEQHQALYTILNHLMHPELAAQYMGQLNAGMAQQQAPQLQNSLLAAGAGQGSQEGAVLHLNNEAGKNTASYAANLFSPEGEMSRAAAIPGIGAPDLTNLQALHGINASTQHNPNGLAVAGNLLGNAASAWAGTGFKTPK